MLAPKALRPLGYPRLLHRRLGAVPPKEKPDHLVLKTRLCLGLVRISLPESLQRNLESRFGFGNSECEASETLLLLDQLDS